MMFLNSMKWCCIAIILSALMGSTVLADVIYCEVFPNGNDPADQINVPLSEAGWHINSDAGTMPGGCYISYFGNKSVPGAATVEPVNSFPANSVVTHGYMIGVEGVYDTDYFHWTTEYTVDRSQWEVTDVSWTQQNNSTTDLTRVALQINAQWYVTDTTFTSSGIQAMSYDMSGTWSTLDFVVDTTLAIGSQTGLALPEGNITGIGFYNDNRSSMMRYDTVAVNGTAVPEPSTFALLAAGLLGLAGIAWRKKR